MLCVSGLCFQTPPVSQQTHQTFPPVCDCSQTQACYANVACLQGLCNTFKRDADCCCDDESQGQQYQKLAAGSQCYLKSGGGGGCQNCIDLVQHVLLAQIGSSLRELRAQQLKLCRATRRLHHGGRLITVTSKQVHYIFVNFAEQTCRQSTAK